MTRICIIIPPTPGLFNQRTNIPLGPLYVAAVLEQEGVEVELISLLGRDIPEKWPKADLYAMGFATVQAGVAKGIVQLIRSQHPDAKILASGCHPKALPVETLNAGFDSVLSGDAEKTILKVIQDLPDLEKIYYGDPVMDIDEIPFPARHLLLREDLYNEAASATLRTEHGVRHVACVITSRGCPYRCSFCANDYRLRKTRFRSAENVVAEMKWLVDHGINCFKMQDDTMTLSEKHVIGLGNEAEKAFEPGQIFLRIATRVDAFPGNIISSLKKMNVEVVSFGVESGSQKILDLARKGVTVEQTEQALRLAKEHGFSTWGFMIFGLPGECEKTVDETIAFLERNRDYLDTAGWNTFVPYPGTDIFNRPEHYRIHILHEDWNKYYVTHKKSVFALSYDVSFDEMIRLKNKMLQAFIELGYSRKEWEGDIG